MTSSYGQTQTGAVNEGRAVVVLKSPAARNAMIHSVGHKKVDEINGFAGANASASSEAELAEVMTQAMAAA